MKQESLEALADYIKMLKRKRLRPNVVQIYLKDMLDEAEKDLKLWQKLETNEEELKECVRRCYINYIVDLFKLTAAAEDTEHISEHAKLLMKDIKQYIKEGVITWDELDEFGITVSSMSELIDMATKKTIKFLGEKAKKVLKATIMDMGEEAGVDDRTKKTVEGVFEEIVNKIEYIKDILTN
jgi:hypothetical protein